MERQRAYVRVTVNVYAGYPVLAKAERFIYLLNTLLPVSAAVERLFSCVSVIMNDRRTRLTDKNFENFVIWMETK